jgi:hypothetical protein
MRWMEITRNITGSLSGRLSGASILAVASGGAFSANLALTTRGSKQQVTLRPKGLLRSVRKRGKTRGR